MDPLDNAFLLVAPSAVGDGAAWCPPEYLRGAPGVPDGDEARHLRELAEDILDLPGVLGLFDHAVPADTGILAGEEFPPESRAELVAMAVDHRFCLTTFDLVAGAVGEILVNATGPATDCLMWDSHDRITTHVDRRTVGDLLKRDISRCEEEGGSPSVTVEPVDGSLSPVPGVHLVHAVHLRDRLWVVSHATGGPDPELEVTVDGVEEVVRVVGNFIDGDAAEFLGRDWNRPGIVPDDDGDSTDADESPVTVHFFLAADFDDDPGQFRTSRDFELAAEDFNSYARDPAADRDAVPEVLDNFADWMNRRAVRAADDPDNPPADMYMDLDPFPVRPRGRMLSVTVPLVAHVHDDTFVDLLVKASSLGLCMLEENGTVWVNASGPVTDCRVSVRGGGVVLSATPESLRSTLEAAVFAGVEGFVLSVEPSGRAVGPPVPGVSEVQVGIGENSWIIHRLSENRRFSLTTPGTTVDDVIELLVEYLTGDTGALLGRDWEDISEGTVPDGSSRWQLSDSTGNILEVGEQEVHVAVPMNYDEDLNWFQVSDRIVQGDYITVSRHLGTKWSVMWGHGFGEEHYFRRIVDTREDAETLIHAWIDEPESDFLDRGWELVDND
ncbi:hypothetical protein [Corynebacterium provencense]|jgi:hypothetical protein|uniref:hypothetical protein n=1 Tax=Corynebacterium provencense TaxID=1737425 RepID=UPI000833F786|nr:hypothetical protein [Corynebacterium provencense]MCI1255252.1 hypothetical protein [Corynebacterium provencense]